MKKKHEATNTTVNEQESVNAKTVNDVAAVPIEVESSTILNQLLEQVQQLQRRLEQQEFKYREETEELQERLREAEARTKAIQSELKPDGAGSMTTEVTQVLLRNDRPETNIERKLDIMERLARENNQPFDRDRTRRVLLGLPVEDANRYVYMGHAFESEEEMQAYKEKVQSEITRTAGKYGNYRR